MEYPPFLQYGLFDADNHYYEPRDCFTRHAPAAMRDRTVRIETGPDGAEQIRVGDREFTFLAEAFSATVTKPGALRDMLRALSSGRYKESDAVEPVQPAYVSRDARLAVMDEQGVERILLFPTLGVCVEHFMKDDPELLYGSFHAFNLWLDEEWGFDHHADHHSPEGGARIHAAPVLSLRDLDMAVQELDFVLGRGARVVGLRPGPAYGRSPADPHFDPFWARLDEARVPVAFHIGESGYNEMTSPHWGEEANPSSHKQSAFQWTTTYGDRPIMDTFAALILHNLFGRFANVRCLSVENGSLWVPYLLKVMNKMNGMGRNGPWLGGRVTERPSDIFMQHVFVSPYHEEDIVALTETIGVGQVLFGSDFPHPEGLAEPREFAERLAGLDDHAVRRVMRDNLAGLLGEVTSPV